MFDDELTRLTNKIKGLEEKIRSLRTSRQVLMNLLSVVEKDRRAKINRLEHQNQKLKRSSTRFARAVFERNSKICYLENALRTDRTLLS